MTVSCVDNQKPLNHNTGTRCCDSWPYVWGGCGEAALNLEVALFVGPAAADPAAVKAARVPIGLVCGCEAMS